MFKKKKNMLLKIVFNKIFNSIKINLIMIQSKKYIPNNLYKKI
jgi:hypothetical protein